MPLFDELFDGFDLLGNVLCGAGTHIWLKHVERVPVVDKRLRIVAGQVPDVDKLLTLF